MMRAESGTDQLSIAGHAIVKVTQKGFIDIVYLRYFYLRQKSRFSSLSFMEQLFYVWYVVKEFSNFTILKIMILYPTMSNIKQNLREINFFPVKRVPKDR